MQILLLAVLFLLLALGVVIVDSYVQRSFLSAKDRIFRQIEEQYNVRLSYREISPSFLSSLRIKGLRIVSTSLTKPWELDCDNLRIVLDPLAVLSPDFSANPEIIIRKVVIRKGRLSIQSIASGKGIEDDIADFLAALKFPRFDISMRNFNLVFLGENAEGNILVNRLNVKSFRDQVRINWRIEGHLRLLAEPSLFREVDFANKTGGVASHDGSFFNLDTQFTDLETDIMVFRPLKFNAALRDRECSFRKIEDDQPYDLEMVYRLDTSTLSASFISENWAPGTLFQFIPGKDPGIGDFLDSRITCSASLDSDIRFETPVYDFDGDLNIHHPLVTGKAVLSARLNGDNELMDFQEMSLITDWGSAFFTGIFSLKDLAPKGQMQLKNIETPFDYKVNSVLDLSYDDNVILVDSIMFSAGKMTIDDITLLIQKSKDDFYATLLVGFGKGEEILVDISRSSRNGSFYGWQFNITARDIGADKVARLLSVDEGLAARGSQWNINMILDGILTPGGKISARLDYFTLASQGDKERSLKISGDFSNANFNFDSIVLTSGNEILTGQCLGLIDDKGFRMQSLFYYNDNPYGIDISFKGGNSLLVRGDYGMNGMFTNSSSGRYYFYLSFDELPVPLNEGDVTLSCQMSGYFKSQDDWQVLVKKGEWTLQKSPLAPGSRLVTTFRVSPRLVDLYSISFKDRYSDVKGYGQFRIVDWDTRDFLGWIRAGDGEKGELYRGNIISGQGKLSGDLTINHFPLARVDILKMTGTAGGKMHLGGSWENPVIEGSLATQSMKYKSEPGKISGDFIITPEIVQISSLDILFGSIALEKVLLQLDRNDNEFIGSGGLVYSHFDSKLAGRFSAEFQLEHSRLGELFTQEELNGRLYVSDLYWDGVKAFPEQFFSIVKQPEFVSVRENKNNSADFFYNRQNDTFEVLLDNPWPLTLHAKGRIAGGQIDASVDNLVFHLPVLNYLMVKDLYLKDYFVVFKEGMAAGDLIVNGNVEDPSFFGTLVVNNLLVDTPYTYSEIGKTDITIQFADKEIVLEPFTIPVGTGFLSADAVFGIDHWIPSDFAINTRARGKGRSLGVQAYYPLPYIDFDGVFTGNILIEGDRTGTHFSGDVLFHKLTVTPGSLIEPLQTGRNDYPYRITTDLRFKTGRDVVFYLPDKKNRIVEAVVNPGETLLMKADTLSRILILNGILTLKSGEINYFGKVFNLTEGIMTFNEDQNKFDPYLSVKAEIRTHDEDGEETVISMIYDAPISVLLTSFEPRFSSIPSKSQNEILTMLGQSFIPYDVQQEDWGAVPIRIAGDYLLEPNVIRPVEDILKDSLGLDMISIRTNIVENAILDRIYFNEYYVNADYDFSLGRYLDNTSFFMGQYLGSNLFLSGSMQFKYTEEMQENPLLDSLNLQTIFNFGLELKTPLLIISWNYSPGLTGENFVADNQITLKWKFQF
jgi:hypothetical protein